MTSTPSEGLSVAQLAARSGIAVSALVERLRAVVPASAVVRTDDVAWPACSD